MIITIDGPTGTGKSTVARLLAKLLSFVHFDTGAMYRCFTFGILKHKINPDDKEAIETFVQNFAFEIKVVNEVKCYFYEGQDITEEIRKNAVTTLVSKVSAIPSVREKLVVLQRKFGKGSNAVFEGRDIGTVVFPEADLKIYLTASPEVRAKRRFDELRKKFPEDSADLTLEMVLKSLTERDAFDSTREHSPLRKAKDAILVDTTHLPIDEVISEILQKIPKSPEINSGTNPGINA